MALIDNLVSYWKLDESSGNAADAHGSNTLTNNNSTAYASAKINNGADFEESSSQSLSINNASQSGLNVTGSFSISCWAKAESINGTDIMVSRYDNSGVDGYLLGINATGPKVICQIDANDLEVVTTFNTGTFYHVVLTYDSGASTTTLYKDGSSIGSEGSVTAPTSNTADFKIGDGVPAVSHFFDGIIDEVGFWSRALTSDEVTSLYNGGAGLAYPFSTTAIKTWNGLADASTKTQNGLARASIKNFNGLA